MSETLAQRAERWALSLRIADQPITAEFIEDLAAETARLARERDEARGEAYDLRLTILGGEDAPGFAGSIPLDTIKDQHAEHMLSMQWRAEAAERDRDAAHAARAAAEAERDRCREALAEARAHIADERKSLVECDTIPDANEWRDESTMDDLTKEAVAEIDAIFSRIDAALAAGKGEAE